MKRAILILAALTLAACADPQDNARRKRGEKYDYSDNDSSRHNRRNPRLPRGNQWSDDPRVVAGQEPEFVEPPPRDDTGVSEFALREREKFRQRIGAELKDYQKQYTERYGFHPSWGFGTDRYGNPQPEPTEAELRAIERRRRER